jgi:hypothetical protein
MSKLCNELQYHRLSGREYWVSPLGHIFVRPIASAIFGNRGNLYHAGVMTRPWDHIHWICCRGCLASPGSLSRKAYTRLNFNDEAVALAVGHRPCARCRRVDYRAFKRTWSSSDNRSSSHSFDAIDRTLHFHRMAQHERPALRADSLPDYTFVLRRHCADPMLVFEGALRRWLPSGYSEPIAVAASEKLHVLTSRPILDVLRSGYKPLMGDSWQYLEPQGETFHSARRR